MKFAWFGKAKLVPNPPSTITSYELYTKIIRFTTRVRIGFNFLFCFQGFVSIILLATEIYIVHLFYKEQNICHLNRYLNIEWKFITKYNVKLNKSLVKDIHMLFSYEQKHQTDDYKPHIVIQRE